ncbi:MAG: peptide chain release factor N(5)-glutamine methyltransferase [Polyangia bacterium]|nr:peptide chain release factor N(5)-glutamine methyltransferase [Polyangia bacterium]
MSPQLWTVRDVLGWTTERFRKATIPSPRLDAELLLAHALGGDRVGLYIDMDRPLSEDERARYRGLVSARLERRPVAYLLGRREFYSRAFEVSEAVLVPRPETEVLVEQALASLEGVEAPRILDLGTGSGAIAVTIAAERPDARVVATDLSAEALEVASRNAERHGVGIQLRRGDLFDALTVEDPPFHAIVANLPYVSADQRGALEPELGFEPPLALFAKGDGLEVIRRCVAGAPARLARPGGRLWLEIGADQAEAVCAMARDQGPAAEPRVIRDLAGLSRVVCAEF